MMFLITGLAIFIRFYRIGDLAVFLADQASDSLAVLNILKGKLTLLGPITSVGGFYNGPIVYYLMLPFYWLFRGDPLSGTIFQTTLQIMTVPFVYLIGKKLKNRTVGLLAAFLFVISPLMIDYSRAAFNSYPAVFFSALILYLFLKIIERVTVGRVLVLGTLLGFILQMHYFTVSILLLVILYPVFFRRQLISLKYYFLILIGFLIGLFPFLIFELRHQFLNTGLLIKYLTGVKEAGWSLEYAFRIWPEITGKILFGNSFIMGVAGFLTMIITIAYSFFKKNSVNNKYLPVFYFLFFIVFIIGFLFGQKIQTHYIVSFHVPLIILFAYVTVFLFEKKKHVLLLFSLIMILINAFSWNLDKEKHPLQDGLSIKDFKKAAKIINGDKKGVYNVAMHAQGDNRAMPLRYTLALLNEKPVGYENYSDITNLYFIVRKNEPLTALRMWEYTSFGQSKTIKKWEINERYFLYKLAKN